MKERRKQSITDLLSLSKLMEGQGLGEITERKFVMSYKGQEFVESQDCLRSEGKRHITNNYFSERISAN